MRTHIAYITTAEAERFIHLAQVPHYRHLERHVMLAQAMDAFEGNRLPPHVRQHIPCKGSRRHQRSPGKSTPKALVPFALPIPVAAVRLCRTVCLVSVHLEFGSDGQPCTRRKEGRKARKEGRKASKGACLADPQPQPLPTIAHEERE